MISSQDIQTMISSYLAVFPDAEHRTGLIRNFLATTDGTALFDRRNPAGHITASAIVCDAAARNVLLLKHRSLGRWLQPGGHVEETDMTLLAAALREVHEETGFGYNQYRVLKHPSLLFDVDSHFIPALPDGGEGPHYHHDVRFLLQLIDARTMPRAAACESQEFRWIGIDRLPDFFDRPDLGAAFDAFLPCSYSRPCKIRRKAAR